jgi:hypothetical protein
MTIREDDPWPSRRDTRHADERCLVSSGGMTADAAEGDRDTFSKQSNGRDERCVGPRSRRRQVSSNASAQGRSATRSPEVQRPLLLLAPGG